MFIRACLLVLGICCLLPACSSLPATGSDSADSNKQQAPTRLEVNTKAGTEKIEPLVVSYEKDVDFDDPLEWINRPVFEFNDVLYRYALVPVSRGYIKYTPDFFQTGVSNFFNNLDEPLNVLNYAAQLEGKASGRSLARFLINTTVGILGLFDPATHWFEIEYQDTSLNNTLASYQVDYGAFLVLPVLGQTDLRNGVSTIAEGLAHPINFTTDNPDAFYIQAYGKFHQIAPSAVNYESLRAQSEDPYVFFRNLYLQSVLRDQTYQYPAQPAQKSSPENEQNAEPQKNSDPDKQTINQSEMSHE